MKVKILAFLCFALFIAGTISYVNSVYYNQQTKTCLVTGKESVNTQEGHEYRVYTSCGTYVIQDSLSLFRYNSSDIYGNIVVNTEYDIYSGGYRLSVLSIFPNIISVKKTQ